jgi:hypothetical protein
MLLHKLFQVIGQRGQPAVQLLLLSELYLVCPCDLGLRGLRGCCYSWWLLVSSQGWLLLCCQCCFCSLQAVFHLLHQLLQ